MAVTIDENYRRVVKQAVKRNITGEKTIHGIFSILANCRRTLDEHVTLAKEASSYIGASRSIRAFNMIAEMEGHAPLVDSVDFDGVDQKGCVIN